MSAAFLLATAAAVLIVVAALCLVRIKQILKPRDKRIGKKLKEDEKCSTVIVLGSGGHTMEMLALVKKLDLRKYDPVHVVVAETDQTSLPKLSATHPDLAEKAVVHRIRRSREVGQSFLTSFFTTIQASLDAFLVVLKVQPMLILCNGPGTCLPVCLGGLFLRFFGIIDPCLIFVESFCRVKSLSLTGKLMYNLADRFLVQWPELAELHKRAEYIGQLF